MGVPSHGFRGVLTELARELRPWVPVVSLVKGLEQGTNMRMSQIIEELLPGHPAGILAGPNIAREVAEGYAAAAVLAMPDQHLATRLSALFRTRRFRVYTTDDVVGVEMAGALKNVFAIAVGMGYSLGIGENTRATGDRPLAARDDEAGRGGGRSIPTPSPDWPVWATSSSPAPASAAATVTSVNSSAPASRSTRSSHR